MNKKTDENAISMFDAIDEQEKPVIEGSRIDVVRMEYAGAESMIWEELFDG